MRALVLALLLFGCGSAESETKVNKHVGTIFCLGTFKYSITACSAKDFLGIGYCTVALVGDPLSLSAHMPVPALDAVIAKAAKECP